jgi:uncharacterized protein (TIGR02118 family)
VVGWTCPRGGRSWTQPRIRLSGPRAYALHLGLGVPRTADRRLARHYREVHVPLVKKLLGIRRYTLSREPTPIRDATSYLVAELDWDDMDALEQAFQPPEGRATAGDVPNLTSDGAVRSMIYELQDV